MLNVKELSLDLGKRTSNQHVIIAQGDTNGTTIEATIYDHGTKLADTGLTAYFVMLLPDGEHYVRDAAEYDTGVITYTVNEAYAAAVTGYTPTAYFELHDGRDTLVATTERFSVTIEQCAYDGLEPAESWDSAIAQLVIDGAEAVNAVEDALDTLVDQEQSMLTGATATVDATTGTPTVTVTMGEPQEGGRSANFAFGGIKGEDGQQGPQGADGYSPTVAITSTTDEHTVTITDAQGPHDYSVPTYADEEQARATAETARSNAESARASEWATIKTEAQDTISAAEDATDAAESAAADATAAAAEARAASAATWLSGNVLFGELAEGTVLTADDVYAAPPKGVEVYGKSTQAGTPTPDAPVPINSVDDLTLHVCGKNLFDPSHILDASGWTVSDGVYTGNIADLTRVYGSKNRMYPIGGLSGIPQSYTLSFDYVPTDSAKITYVGFVYTDGTDGKKPMGSAGRKSFTSDGSKSLAGLYFTYGTGQTVSFSNIQLELGSTATDYEPYVGASVSIPLSNHLARSLPDGTRDSLTLSYIGPSETEGWGVFSKVLTQRVIETVIDGNSSIAQVANTNYLRINLNVAVVENSTALTDQLAWNSGGAATNTITIGANRTVFAWLSYSDFPTLADYKAHLAEHPMTLLYALATPVTHDLGTIELPVNPAPYLTAWADGGSAQPTMALEYERDVNIALVMERDKAMAEIAPLETSPTKANHSVGTYLMYDGTLYKVTRAIASGEQITPGTNVTATTVAAELLALA